MFAINPRRKKLFSIWVYDDVDDKRWFELDDMCKVDENVNFELYAWYWGGVFNVIQRAVMWSFKSVPKATDGSTSSQIFRTSPISSVMMTPWKFSFLYSFMKGKGKNLSQYINNFCLFFETLSYSVLPTLY